MSKNKGAKTKTLVTRKSNKKKVNIFVHPTAVIEKDVEIGAGTKIWHYAQIRSNSRLGKNCVVGKSVFIDTNSEIGDNCKFQNHAIVYHKAIIGNGVFIGPNVCFTNDKIPRAINPDGSLKSADDWQVTTIKIGEGASIGAHSVITPGVTIGRFALAGSGSVITKDVPDFALVYGNPARIRDFVCFCGQKLINILEKNTKFIKFKCACGEEVTIPLEIFKQKANNLNPKNKVWIR